MVVSVSRQGRARCQVTRAGRRENYRDAKGGRIRWCLLLHLQSHHVGNGILFLIVNTVGRESGVVFVNLSREWSMFACLVSLGNGKGCNIVGLLVLVSLLKYAFGRPTETTSFVDGIGRYFFLFISLAWL